MEKFNNQKKEDRRDFIKKTLKSILGISAVGGLTYVNKKLIEELNKELEKGLEKKLSDNIKIIKEEAEKIDEAIEDDKIYYKKLSKEIKIFMEQEEKINIFDKKNYLKKLLEYQNHLENELKIINIKNEQVDLISKIISEIIINKNIKHKLDKEKINLLNQILKNNFELKQKLLKLKEELLELKSNLLNLIEKVHNQLEPNKKLA